MLDHIDRGTLLRHIAVAAIAIGCLVLAVSARAENPVPLTRAHAHNDYEHKRPLLDALDQGFSSVEADVFLVGDKLLVGHTRSSLRPERTLEALYLEPLKARVAKNGGRVYRDGGSFTLFIDIKTNGAQAYAALRDVLARHRDMISSSSKTGAKRRAIDVVVSGDRPVAEIAADKDRMVGIDGRLSDLDSDAPNDFLPLISDNWRSHFQWRGTGPISAPERQKLRSIVKKAHEHGRRVRFWATPERDPQKTTVWRELYAADVDLINTDDLAGLAQFLRQPARATGATSVK